MKVLLLCVAVCLAADVTIGPGGEVETPTASPTLPAKFRGRLTVTSHLVDKSKEYPPWRRVIDVSYDLGAGRAKATVVEGYEAGRTYIRHYGDVKEEYMVKTGRFPGCQRSYLGEAMPPPAFPALTYDRVATVGDFPARVFVARDGPSLVSVYDAAVAADLHVPLRLDSDMVTDDGSVEKLSTFQWSNLVLDPEWGEAEFDIPPPHHSRKNCTRHVGGFPYLHLFHHYLRV